MAQYFSAYRIDHILGFFRIWEIERRYDTRYGGLMGYYQPALAIAEDELRARGLWDMRRLTGDDLYLD